MKPVYDDGRIRLFHSDAREVPDDVLRRDGERFGLVYLDPLWPLPEHSRHAGRTLPKAECLKLLRSLTKRLRFHADRLVIHVDNLVDPRFVGAVNARWPFLRESLLINAQPVPAPNFITTHHRAYLYGEWPAGVSRASVGGIARCTRPNGWRVDAHPFAKHQGGVRQLLEWFAHGPVLDPCAGSGTTLAAAKELGIPATGIEIDPEAVALAVARLQATQPGLWTRGTVEITTAAVGIETGTPAFPALSWDA